MSTLPNCPKCDGEYTYETGNMYVCPECAHEWSQFQEELDEQAAQQQEIENAIRDAYGNILKEGDNGTIVRDVKITGSSDVIKQGTRITDIRFESDGVHDITARVDGFGSMNLKSELVRKI